MLKNRLVLIIFILASGTFASFFGGNIAYMMFSFALIIPFVALIYTLIVYLRFCIYQEIPVRTVVKGEPTTYTFVMSNEDKFTFTDVKVNFYKDKSEITETETICKYCLLANTSKTMETTLVCNYRGNYFVGAKSVEITDFLYLFTITYPMKSQIRLSVCPRVVPLENLMLVKQIQDSKNIPFLQKKKEDQIDVDVRRYVGGDNKKFIHWKASAKKYELLTRRYAENEKSGTTLVMDLIEIKESELDTVIIEDRILELSLSIVEYYKRKQLDIRVSYQQRSAQELAVRSDSDFDFFYKQCVNIRFNAEKSLTQLLEERLEGNIENSFYILVTHELTAELCECVGKMSHRGDEITVLFICDTLDQEMYRRIHNLNTYGVVVENITFSDTVSVVCNES